MEETAERPSARLAEGADKLCRRAWWTFLIGGIASVIFGVLAFINPGVALTVLAMYFAAYVLVDGVVNVVGSIQNRDADGWWVMLLLGILGIAVGGYALLNPALSIGAFIYVVAFMAILTGFMLLSLGFKVRKAVEGEWMLYLTGALSIVVGGLIAANPVAGSVSIIYFIAGWAVLIGILKIVIGFKVKSLPEKIGERLQGALG
ncbi:MAG: HdeD family acid-resistance protein [Planctomycetota bacterium]